MWQPIETAQLDHKEIVIWNPMYRHCPIAIRVYGCDDYPPGWKLKDGWSSPVPSETDDFIGWQEDIDNGYMPTMWAPLPESE